MGLKFASLYSVVSNDRELSRLSFETKLSSIGASKLQKLCFECARGNFGPFWKLWTTFKMAATYAMYSTAVAARSNRF
jgi:hypothetical protein